MLKWTWISIGLCVVLFATIAIVLLKTGDNLSVGKSTLNEELSCKKTEKHNNDQAQREERHALDVENAPGEKTAKSVAVVLRDKTYDRSSAPASVSLIAGWDTNENYLQRVRELNALGTKLSNEEIAGLFAFMEAKEVDMGVDRMSYLSLKNDVLEKLIRQDSVPAELSQLIVDICNNPAHDALWRDYCVQYMATLYERKRKDEGERFVVTAEKDLLVETLWAVVGSGGDASGSALIGLDELSRKYSEISRERLLDVSANIVNNNSSESLAKTSAIQICSRAGNKEILPTVRSLAESSESLPLRMSAIAALGDIGEKVDKEYLESLVKTAKAPLLVPAQKSLERLVRRTRRQRDNEVSLK